MPVLHYLGDTTGVELFVQNGVAVGFGKALLVDGPVAAKMSHIYFLPVMNLAQGFSDPIYRFGALPIGNFQSTAHAASLTAV